MDEKSDTRFPNWPHHFNRPDKASSRDRESLGSSKDSSNSNASIGSTPARTNSVTGKTDKDKNETK